MVLTLGRNVRLWLGNSSPLGGKTLKASLGAPAIHRRPHRLDGVCKPEQHRMPDEEMSDVELNDLRDRGDAFSGREIETVARMNFQTKAVGQASPLDDAPPFGFGIAVMTGRHGLAPGAGMDLDAAGPDRGGGVDLRGFGGNEQGHPNSASGEFSHQRLEPGYLPGGVKPPFGRAFRAPLRYQTGRMRPGFERDPQHLIRCRHFQIERRGDLGLQSCDILVADMTTILAQVRRNATGTGRYRQVRGAYRVRVVPAAGISQRRHMVNIDAQSQIGNVYHGATLPQLVKVSHDLRAPLMTITVPRP